MGTKSLIFKAGTLISVCATTFHSAVRNPWPGVQGIADGQGSLQELAGVAQQLVPPSLHPPPRRDRGGPTVLLISRQLLSCCPRDESRRQQLLAELCRGQTPLLGASPRCPTCLP